uniref:Intersectin 2a n=1 Tax=Cyprinus carpio TaxID=7962 RepID=A0A8C1L8V5_CYPCA
MAFFRILALLTMQETGKHDKQFDSLAPTLGYLSGDQARKFFLQSGLPTAVLADIWALADIGKDGKMDRLEFSIAMKLIKLQLQGQPLPSSLPIIMKQTPTPAMTPSSRFGMMMPILTAFPAAPAMTSLVPVPTLISGPLPQMPSSLSVPALPNGNANLLTPTPGTHTNHLFLNFHSSNSSSTTSLASNSPKMNASDWAVPQSSRLKYRQQFNSLDKLMSGYLSGPQVRNALTASNLTQTQLATIWALADVDRDGQLRAEEFILAMHLVDMAKTGRPLPLTLPSDLDKLKENFQRGNAELEKRRLALREEERREEERRRQKEREEREQKEREAREMELRRQREEERRIERQRELERQREEERLKELERREAAERQRRMEWEKSKRVELQTQREKEQSDIQRLKDRKRSLEMELEAVVRLPLLLFYFFFLPYTCSPSRLIHPVLWGMMVMLYYKLNTFESFHLLGALYPFTARNSDELTLEADCLIEVDESTVRETGWLYGSYRGNSGWFPESYAERCSKGTQTEWTATNSQSTAPSTNYPGYEGPTPTHTPVSSNTQHSQVGICEYTQTYHISYNIVFLITGRNMIIRILRLFAKTDSHLGFSKDDIITVLEKQENWCYGELNESRGWFPCSYVSMIELSDSGRFEGEASVYYVALYTYESPESGDLTFCADDVVLVTEREGEWWRGCIGDQSGLFPSNYVKPKEPDTANPGVPGKKPEIAQVTTANAAKTPEQLSLTPGQLIVVLHKNSNSWWLGELQARGKKRKKGWFHSSNVRLLEANSGKITPASQPLCQVIAMYDYKAANKDEMSFQKGQLITVLNKDNPDWWKGEVAGVIGLFPTNYVKMTTECDPSQQWCADLLSLDTMGSEERKRQGYIHELIQTEESYLEDLELALEVFYKPMAESGRLTEAEMSMIFVNWRELIMCSTKLLKALRVRKKMAGERMPVQVVGDILSSELSHMQAYIRFCSCQLNAAALLQQKTDKSADFKLFLKKIASNYRCKGMPLSSFLLKPMQRITRYPLLIKNILENTPSTHADHANLQAALEQAEELCSQVNEGVREKENSDRLEWIQNHVLCDGVIEHLVFNSLTNCLGPRKLLHSGKLHKTKSNKELWAFLFNDFLLLTYTSKQFSSGPDKLFNPNSNAQYKMYKTPVFLNEVLVKMPSDPSSDDPIFHISHIDRVYTLKADSIYERTTWVQKIKAASDNFIETEKLKREKAYQARSQKNSGIGRLLVTVLEATELKPCKPNGKSNPYCELTMGAQCYTSRHQPDTLNPKWNFNCHFFIKDLYQDVLCLTIFERDQFSPDDFLGRTEVPVATIKKDQDGKGPLARRLLLHEVPTGEVKVRLDLQLYDQTPHP